MGARVSDDRNLLSRRNTKRTTGVMGKLRKHTDVSPLRSHFVQAGLHQGVRHVEIPVQKPEEDNGPSREGNIVETQSPLLKEALHMNNSADKKG